MFKKNYCLGGTAALMALGLSGMRRNLWEAALSPTSRCIRGGASAAQQICLIQNPHIRLRRCLKRSPKDSSMRAMRSS